MEALTWKALMRSARWKADRYLAEMTLSTILASAGEAESSIGAAATEAVRAPISPRRER